MSSFAIILFTFSAVVFNQFSPPDTNTVFEEYIQIPADSIMLGDYRIVTYHYADSAGNPQTFYNVIRAFKGQRQLLYIPDRISSLYNLCWIGLYFSDNCFLNDINGDGVNEIIIYYGTGGASCCEGAGYIYALSDSARLLLSMEPTVRSFEIEDIENDSVPEIITYDDTFGFFMEYPYREFMQPLIWKWDGSKYRIANGRFADWILKDLRPIPILPDEDLTCAIDLQITVRKSIKAPSPKFLYMIFGHYFAGRPDEADSLFKIYWPSEVLDKDNYYTEIKRRINANPLWPQIIDSNW